jgi:hypothetical protein
MILLGEDLLHDGGVAARQVETRLFRLPPASCRQGDHVGVGHALVTLGADLDVVQVRGAVGEVEHFAKRLLAVDVDQADATRHVLQQQCVGQRRSDVSRTDDGHLHACLSLSCRRAPG